MLMIQSPSRHSQDLWKTSEIQTLTAEWFTKKRLLLWLTVFMARSPISCVWWVPHSGTSHYREDRESTHVWKELGLFCNKPFLWQLIQSLKSRMHCHKKEWFLFRIQASLKKLNTASKKANLLCQFGADETDPNHNTQLLYFHVKRVLKVYS